MQKWKKSKKFIFLFSFCINKKCPFVSVFQMIKIRANIQVRVYVNMIITSAICFLCFNLFFSPVITKSPLRFSLRYNLCPPLKEDSILILLIWFSDNVIYLVTKIVFLVQHFRYCYAIKLLIFRTIIKF